MKIVRFHGTKINGYLDLDVKFNGELTFVTGINGSGKTTALNSIISLLMPRLDFLTMQDYERLSIEIEHESKRLALTSWKSKNGAQLFIDSFPDNPLTVVSIEWDETASLSRNREMEQSFFREQLSQNINHPVMQFIQSLPTPMFLGLDRRTTPQDESLHRYPPRTYLHNRPTRRNVFSQSLSQSLAEALGFAFENYRNSQKLKARVDDEFRRDLVLDLIDFTPLNFPPTIEMPSRDEFQKIDAAKKNLLRLPELLGISEEKITEKLGPLFKFFEDTERAVSKASRSKRSRPNDEDLLPMLAWSLNQIHLTKISSLSDRISKYNQKVDRCFRETRSFLDSLDLFFRDRALLHKSAERRGSPFPGQTYPTASVTGMPSAV